MVHGFEREHYLLYLTRGNFSSQWKERFSSMFELEQAVLDAVLYGEGYLIDGLRVDPKKVKHIEIRDTSVSEKDGYSEDHF